MIGGPAVALIAAAVTAYVLWMQPKTAEVDTGRISIVQPTRTVMRGDEVSFAVHIDSPVSIDTVTATLRYDTELLTYKKTTYDTANFGSHIPAIAQGDTVMVQAAKLGGEPVQGDMLVATITFVAQRDGTTTVVLAEGDAARAGAATHPQLEPKGDNR